ncbi:hypothetical protein K2173_001035 [Erythroxylum novogranatense]|uniref:DUF7950 domain-containing protein n=1 Tax=Erythroxylum novogranatense TaxID=1862640 RepID=A0AAV8SJ43_9ROSI|nr:hypothetical protein K2173_001035 [Erythroxylum novogranatense]
MDRRGGCCISRYGGGAYNMSKVDLIMLRFRPIAPKPASTSATASVASPSEGSEFGSKSCRGKRRYRTANVSNNKKSCTRKRKVLRGEKVDEVVTLPLLPESSDWKGEEGYPAKQNVPTWLSFGGGEEDVDHDVKMLLYEVSADRTVVMPHVSKVVGSCLTVECVTDTWVDEDGLGHTDEQKRRNLERDTCPGLISDEFGRVTWTNEAYRKMVSHSTTAADDEADDGGVDGVQVTSWLVMKERLLPAAMTLAGQRAFTCRVRLEYQSTCVNGNGKEMRTSSTVPCDVWRMDGGGYAWRLDVKAALCLGR